jgi:hypothetical protein
LLSKRRSIMASRKIDAAAFQALIRRHAISSHEVASL